MSKPLPLKKKALLGESVLAAGVADSGVAGQGQRQRKRPARPSVRNRDDASPPRAATTIGQSAATEAAPASPDCESRGVDAPREFILDALRDGLPDRAILALPGERFNLPLAERLAALDSAYQHAARFFMERRSAPEHAARSLLLRDELMRKAIVDGDYRIALSALESRDKLLGLASREGLVSDAGARTLMELAELASRFRQEK